MNGRTTTWLFLACLATLALSFHLRQDCTYEDWNDFYQYRHYCYSDILPLYGIRHLDQDAIPYKQEFSEYPVLTGHFTWVVAKFTDGLHSYMTVTFAALMLAGLLTTLFLAWSGVEDRYVLAWAISPALVVHAYTNWDLLAVALAMGGWLAWTRGRLGTSALLFGLGGAAKLYPAFFLPLLFVQALRDTPWTPRPSLWRSGPARTLLGGTVGFGLPNLFVYLTSPDNWWAIWRFHAARNPDFETPWEAVRLSYLQNAFPNVDWGAGYRHFVGTFGAVSLVVALLVLAVCVWLRRTDALAAGALVTLVFLLTNRVYSPQYTLWALPLLVALRAPWGTMWAYVVADTANFLIRYPYFTPKPGAPDTSWNDDWAPWSHLAVGVRWLLLLTLTVALFRRMVRSRLVASAGPGDHDGGARKTHNDGQAFEAR